MRLTILLLTAVFISAHATGVAQNVTISGKDLTLKQVFNAIEKQTGYVILANKGTLSDTRRVSLSVYDLSLNSLLDMVLKDQFLKYVIKDKTIVVSHNFFVVPADQPPAPPVKLRVVDSLGKPLAGASVQIRGRKVSGMTDADGTVNLNVQENDVILISFVGYDTQTIFYNAGMLRNGELAVTLQASLNRLKEVAIEINTGYQQIKPEQMTGSVYTLRAKEYDSRINTTDFLTGLQNKIPGLLINNDIKFEGNSLFQIRGISTIKGNRSPLIVVDGYPTELSLEMIDPNEIESVTVLKDAAAATIYGARSSNGVIIIERKKAKVGKVRVNFRATTGFRPKENYERYRWDEDASKISVEYEKLRTINFSQTAWASLGGPTGYSTYNAPTLTMIHWRSNTSPISTEERDRQLAAIGSYNNTSDYGDLFLRTAATQTYNLDMSGGNDRVLYYLTANYSRNSASQIKNNNGIFRISGRSTLKLSNRFSLDLTTDLQEGQSNAVPVPDINNIYPYEHFQDENGKPSFLFTGSKGNIYYNGYLKSLGLLDNLYYPLTEINEVSNTVRSLTNRITANFRYNAGNGFTFTFGGVHENSRIENRHLASESSAEVRQYVNYYTKPGTNGSLIYNIPKGAFLKQQTGSTQSYTARAQANYDKQVSEDHSFNIILGAEVRDVITKSNTASYFGYNDQTLFTQPVDFRTLANSYSPTYANVNSAIAYNTLFNQGYSDDRFISGYSNLVYAYKGKYSFTGSMRVDQSNLFGTDPKYKYKPLWSVGVAWNINKENFMQDVSWVRSLRLRAAHGFNGNVAKDALPQVIASDGLNSLDPNSYVPMLTLLSYANSGLRWEQTRNFNVGLNYELFKGISGSIDYYIKKSTDILATNQIDASKGGTSALINQASIRNSGLEVSLQADWISSRKFNWNTGLVFAHNTNKILEVYNANISKGSAPWAYVTGSYSNYLKGYAVGTLFNYRYAGLDNKGLSLIYDKEGKPVTPNTVPAISAALDNAGSSIPVFNLGLSNRVDIGNFYAYCMINYFGKFKVRVPVPDATAIRPLEGAGNYWKQAGDEADPDKLPGLNTTQGLQHYYTLATSDKYTANGSYFTLGDLTAAYSFRNSNLVKRWGISNLEVRAQASNIYTVALNKYNYSMATGSYAKSYLTPTYTAALSLNF